MILHSYTQLPERTIQPPILPIEQIDIPEVEQYIMPNGVELHSLNMGNEDVVRLDIVVQSGKWDANRALETEFCNQILKEGAGILTSAQIAEKLDYYGAWLQTYTTQQCSYLTLYSLNKFFGETIAILEKILKEPVFPEKEFDILCRNRKQQFLVDMDKVQYLSARAFIRNIFGKNHPYGRIAELGDFDTITISDLLRYYTDNYNSRNCRVVLFGKIEKDMLKQVENCFGNSAWRNQILKVEKNFTIQSSEKGRILVSKPDALQSAICVGKQFVTKNHPDYHGLYMLNTLFGGYFGSRLMSNIREDKGYTYGIYSSMTSYLHAGSLNISTQTATEYVEPVIKEIYTEMDKLCNEQIPENELETVRNYLLGETARRFDNLFAIADAYLNLLEVNLINKDFYQQRVDVIKNITAPELGDLARKYYVKEEFYEVIAGK